MGLQLLDEAHRVVPNELMRLVREPVELHVLLRPIEIRVRQIDGRRCLGAAVGCVDGERAGVRKQIQKPLADRRFANHRPSSGTIIWR